MNKLIFGIILILIILLFNNNTSSFGNKEYECFLVKKENGKLVFTDNSGFQNRNPSTFWCIQQADLKYSFKDFREIKIYTGDKTENDMYSYTKINSYSKLVPDFLFHCWKESGIEDYSQLISDINKAGLQPFKTNKVGWIGAVSTSSNRKKMLEIGDSNKEILSIEDFKWDGNKKPMSIPDLVKEYSILIDIEGNGWSARLKALLFSHRPVILVERPYTEFFMEHLKEWEHYIPVKRDLSDLVLRTQWILSHYSESLKIAENAYQFAKKHLTRDACYAKWNEIIRENYS